MERYFGTYHAFKTPSKKDAADLMGPNNLVGDRYTVDCTLEDGAHRAWLVNRFGTRVGFFEEDFSRKLSLLAADGMTLAALLSFVAFSEQPEPGEYWGQMAVIAYAPAYAEEFEPFIAGVSALLGKGIRPKLSFEGAAVEKVIESKGAWMPSERESVPSKEKGMALLKTRRGFTDGLVEAGRSGNKGCYILSWAFLLALVAAIVIALKSCGVFGTTGT